MKSVRRLPAIFDVCRNELSGVNHSTEAEFLGLAKKLDQVSGQAKEVVTKTSLAAGILAGDESKTAINVLGQILEHIESLGRGSGVDNQVLDEMTRHIGNCRRLMKAFPRFVATLKALGMQTRIEAARLQDHDVDFASVADEVQRLAGEIESRSTTIIEDSGALDKLIGESLGRLLHLGERHEREISELLAQSRQSLNSFIDSQAESASAAEAVARRYDGVYRSTCEMVRSLQYQDIVRQQVEHVQEALAELSREVAKAVQTGRRARPELASALALGVIQIGQLKNSRSTLTSAVTSIAESLASLATEVGEISAPDTSQATDVEGHRVFLEASRERLSNMLVVLKNFSSGSKEMSHVVRQVTHGVRATSGLADQIEESGFQLCLAALNAQIKAAHLGRHGAVVGVIAEEIRKFTDGAVASIGQVTEQLRSLTKLVEDFSAEFQQDSEEGNASGEVVTLESLTRNVGERLDLLLDLNRRFAAGMDAARHSGHALQADLRHHCQSIESDKRAAAVFDKVIQQMEGPLSEANSKFSRYAPVGAGTAHLERYTMETERDVHRTLGFSNPAVTNASRETEGKSLEVKELSEPVEPGADENFGDNVSLF